MDFVLEEIDKLTDCGIMLGPDRFPFLAFADDVVFLAEDVPAARSILCALVDTASRIGLQISFQKAELVPFGYRPDCPSSNRHTPSSVH